MDWQARLSTLLGVRLFTVSGTDTTAGSALTIVVILAVTYAVACSVRRSKPARCCE
jgi:hypothetical protein